MSSCPRIQTDSRPARRDVSDERFRFGSPMEARILVVRVGCAPQKVDPALIGFARLRWEYRITFEISERPGFSGECFS